MSVELTLSDNSLSIEDWNALLDEWSEELGDRLYDAPRFEDEEKSLVILGEGSVRGVFIELGDGGARLALNALASRADWRLAVELLMLVVIRDGGVIRDQGAELPLRELTPERADTRALEGLRASVEEFRAAFEEGASKSGVAKLPVGPFRLPLLASDLPRGPEPSPVLLGLLEKTLADRLKRYARAERAKTFVLEDSGLRLSSWRYRPTLVYQAQFIVIRDAEDPVPLEKAHAILGGRLEKAGAELYYLPGLSEDERAELIPRLRESAVNVPGFAKPTLATAVIDDESPDEDSGEAEAAELEEAPDDEPEDEPGDEPAQEPGAYDRWIDSRFVRKILDEMVSDLFASEESGEAAARLEHRVGIDDATVELLMASSIYALRALFGLDGEPRTLEELCDELLEQGLPETLIKKLIAAIYRELSAGA